jgi:hypothetical protein
LTFSCVRIVFGKHWHREAAPSVIKTS